MTDTGLEDSLRCSRCGRVAAGTDKFCAECGMFLRDAFVDERLLLALEHEKEGRGREARQELQRLLDDAAGEVSSLYHLARLRQEQGDNDPAEELLRRTREFALANNIHQKKVAQES